MAKSGCSAAWLARLNGVQEVVGSNPATPTTSIHYLYFVLEDTSSFRYYPFLLLFPDNEISSFYTHSVKSIDDIWFLRMVTFCRYTPKVKRRVWDENVSADAYAGNSVVSVWTRFMGGGSRRCYEGQGDGYRLDLSIEKRGIGSN